MSCCRSRVPWLRRAAAMSGLLVLWLNRSICGTLLNDDVSCGSMQRKASSAHAENAKQGDGGAAVMLIDLLTDGPPMEDFTFSGATGGAVLVIALIPIYLASARLGKLFPGIPQDIVVAAIGSIMVVGQRAPRGLLLLFRWCLRLRPVRFELEESYRRAAAPNVTLLGLHDASAGAAALQGQETAVQLLQAGAMPNTEYRCLGKAFEHERE